MKNFIEFTPHQMMITYEVSGVFRMHEKLELHIKLYSKL
jgi:hypothetical protein